MHRVNSRYDEVEWRNLCNLGSKLVDYGKKGLFDGSDQ